MFSKIGHVAINVGIVVDIDIVFQVACIWHTLLAQVFIINLIAHLVSRAMSYFSVKLVTNHAHLYPQESVPELFTVRCETDVLW